MKRYKIREKPELIPFEKKIDDRGHFSTPFGKYGLDKLTQGEIYISLSYTNFTHTVRGMHFQIQPYSEAKLLKIVQGSVFDILIDLDDSLPIAKRIYQYELSENDNVCLYIPRGYAHGYQTLSDNVLVLYALDSMYSKFHTRGFSPISQPLNELWPAEPINIKFEDLMWPKLS